MARAGNAEAIMAVTPQERAARAAASMARRAEKISDDVRKHMENIPATYQSLFLKSASGDASPRESIKAKCQSCVGYEEVATRVGECTCFRCPLYSYRPYQQGGTQ